jgi:hypothetical protein
MRNKSYYASENKNKKVMLDKYGDEIEHVFEKLLFFVCEHVL